MKNLLILISFLSVFSIARAQEVFVHDVPFATDAPQSMWGPNGVNLGLNQTWDIFGPWTTGQINFPPIGIPPINAPFGAGTFGAWMDGWFELGVGCTFSLENFTLGQVEVDYPIEVTVEAPTDLSYDQGDQIDIETSYEVQPGWALDTYYPNPGSARLTLNIFVGLQMNLNACFIDCFDPISFGMPTSPIPIDIFNIDFDQTDGDGMDAAFIDLPGLGPLFEYDIPDTLYTDMIPNDPLGEYGLSGWFTPPHVDTDDNLVGDDIYACGESQYIHMELELFDLLSNIPVTGFAALAYLQDEISFGPITFSWTIFSAWLQVGIYNKQCFDFEPEVWGRYQFDVPIEYSIIDGVTGAQIGAPDVSNIIDVEIGNTIRMKYPCYMQGLRIIPTYSIDGIFTSHTYDSIPLDFCYTALEFSIYWDDITILPPIPPIPYPCGIDFCGFCDCIPCGIDWCYTDPFGGLTLYDIISPPPPIGPVLDECLPIASFNYDWMPPETWSLPGFDEYTKDPFYLYANQLGVSNTQTNILCYGDNTGAIDVSFSAISPALPFTYEWTNGATTQDLSALIAGPYELSAYDANGCQHFTGATITQPPSEVLLSATVVDQSCNNGVANGQANILIQGGTGPYNVSWSNGMTGPNISGLAPGNYTATVTDNNGCIKTIVVTINQPVALGQVGIVSHVNCNGGVDGAIEIDSYGGTLPHTYSWSNGQTVEDLNGLGAGVYTLTVLDARNCTSIQTYTVQEPAAPISLSATGVDILCRGNSTGSIDLTVNGGTPGYVFTWSNSANIVIPFQSEDLSGMAADEYTVLVTDSKGCQESLDFQLAEPASSLGTAPIVTDLTCNNDFSGAINPQVSGGTSGYNYVWSNGMSSSSITGISAGTYSVLITDNNGCTKAETYIVSEPSPLVLTSMKSDVLCKGDATGIAQVNASGSTPGYSYSWSNGGQSSSITNLIAGTYSVEVSDINGCSQDAVIIINEPLLPLAINYTTVDVDCNGASNGSISMTPSGGTSAYAYLWSTNGFVIYTDTTQDLTNLAAGDYLLTVTDFNACTLDTSITINQPALPLQMTYSSGQVSCFNGSDGFIDISVSGGTPGYNYNWSNSFTGQDLTNIPAGTYSVQVVDQNGCFIDTTYIIDQPDQPLIASTTTSNVSCYDGNNGSVLSSVTGGTSPYSYNWSNGSSTEHIYNLPAGIYTLTITDLNGCTTFTGANVSQPLDSIILTSTVTDVSCYGGSDGLIAISAIGGTPPLYYNWADSLQNLYSYEGDSLNDLIVGDYMIIVTDSKGCRYERWVTINQPTLLQSSHVETHNPCFGDSLGIVDVTNWGGTPPYSMSWSNNSTTEDITGLAAGWYYYTLTDDHGCQLRDSARITEPEFIWLLPEIFPLSCMDQNDAYIEVFAGGGTGEFTYEWSTGSQSNGVYDLVAGTYDVIYMDENGCSDTVRFVIDPVSNSCLEIPNTFTPDGDAYNDTWFIENLYLYPEAEVLVFNKWGNLVFKNEEVYESWDGTVNGQPLPSEVYYYVIRINNPQGEEFHGTITIVR